MSAGAAAAESAETDAIKIYEELVAAKAKEVAALTRAVEEKTVRSGELGVKIVEMEQDLSDTEKALMEDKAFLADMDKSCASKKTEYEAHVQVRSEELVALAETIKVLNDDDALDLFKKTLPSASSSFAQLQASSDARRARALVSIRETQRKYGPSRPELDFLALAMQGKKVNFGKVMGMIDEMIKVLETEQQDDDHKKEYCSKQFDVADDKKKGLEHDISDLERAIADEEDGIAMLTDEINSLIDGVKALDKSVAEATEQRKEEHDDYTELIASNSAAKEVLGFAKNRLNKFYNPEL
jgi:septal ring factor EnvC (AmiA/AmiB activator)